MTEMKTNTEYCSVTAIRYARVLIELGIAKEAVTDAAKILEAAPELIQILNNPVVTKENKYAVIDQIFASEMRNFLKTVIKHEKAGSLQEIFYAYEQQKKKADQIASAKLSYVVPPSKEQLEKMEAFVCDKFQAERVEWTMQEDLELIGGFKLLVDGKEYDYSMQGRLKRLEQKLTRR